MRLKQSGNCKGLGGKHNHKPHYEMNKIYLITLFLVLGACNSSLNSEEIVHLIAREKTLECESISIAGEPSKLYKKFESLKRKSTKEELIQLIEHENPVVVGYASYAILDKKYLSVSSLIELLPNGNQTVETMCGCILSQQDLIDLVYSRYWEKLIDYENYDANAPKIKDTKELQSVDSLILFSNNIDEYLLHKVIKNRVYPISYNTRIVDLGLQTLNLSVLEYIYEHMLETEKGKLKVALNDFLETPGRYSNEIQKARKMMDSLN